MGPASAHADRNYTQRFGAVDRGDVRIVSNTIMTCPTADSRCAGARDATGATIRNSAFTMTHVDVDADAITFNSSSADLRLPDGATVLFAGLYWGSDVAAGEGGVDAPDPSAKGTVLLATGSTWAYQAVTATQIDTSQTFATRYQGFADVTERVRGAGAGRYTVANVQAATGSDNFGGWGLVVAYRDGTAPVRWLGVYDGFHQLTDNKVRSATLAGFRTPASGTVDATFGMMTYEGDLAVTGDYLRIGGRDVTDALHPVGNFFNSLITAGGEHVHSKSPDYVNQLGHEASLIDVDGYIGNGATSAPVELGVGTDYLQSGPMTLAVDHAVDPPVASAPPTIAGEAREGSTLTASPGTWSGSPTYDFQWRRCTATCTDVPGANGTTYSLAAGDVGATIRVRVTATNRDGSDAAESVATATVVAKAPVNTAAPSVSGTAREGETLTASPGTWSGSPTYAYRWQRCATTCQDIAGATGRTHVLTAADVGVTVRVRVVATNSGGTAAAVSEPTGTVVPRPPAAGSPGPSSSGTPREGETLTASPGTWSGSPTYAYQWRRCGQACADIGGATSQTYVPSAADVGFALRVRVTASNDGGSASAESPATAPVIPATTPPANTAAPSIAGTARQGETLTAHPGTWTGGPSYRFQWRRCGLRCDDVPGATGAGYVAGAADVGAVMRVLVTASNSAGTTVAESASTDVVAATPAPAPEEPPAPGAPGSEPRGGPDTPGSVTPSACGALSALYTRGRTGTLRLRLAFGDPVTAVDFSVPRVMRPARRVGRRVGLVRLTTTAGVSRQDVLRFGRASRLGLTVPGRRPQVRLTREGARVERIGPRIRRIELTLTTRRPAPPRSDVTILAVARTTAGQLERSACRLVTPG